MDILGVYGGYMWGILGVICGIYRGVYWGHIGGIYGLYLGYVGGISALGCILGVCKDNEKKMQRTIA